MRRLLTIAALCSLAAGAPADRYRFFAPADPTPSLPAACLPPSEPLPPDLPGPWASIEPTASAPRAPRVLPIVRPSIREQTLTSIAELQGRIAGDMLCNLHPILVSTHALTRAAGASLAHLDLSPPPTPSPTPPTIVAWTLTAASLIQRLDPPLLSPHADLAWAEVRATPAPLPPARYSRILGVAPSEHGTIEAPALDPFTAAAE